MSDLRDDFAAFAGALGVELWPHQVAAAGDPAFITSVAAARRTGKTTMLELLAAWVCFRQAGVQAVIVSATEDASRRVTESLGERLRSHRLTRGAVVDDFAARIRLANGSEILSVPPTHGKVRGLGRRVMLLVVDEAGFIPGERWSAMHYIALDNRAQGSRIILAGTPWGPADHFFRRAFLAGRDGDPDHGSHHWTHAVNPNLDAAYLARMRERVAPSEYAAEVLGEWSDAAGALFPRELLDAHTADVDLPDLLDVPAPLRLPVGLDTGVSFDRSAAAAWARLPVGTLNPDREPLPVFVPLVKVWPVRTPILEPARELAALGERWSVITVETNGVGVGAYQHLRELRGRTLRPAGRRWNPHATSAQSKAAGYGALLALLERGQVVLPRHPDLLRQLAGLRFEQGERGMVRIGAEDAATHDDVADAVMLAAGPYRRDGERALRVVLQHLAGARVPDGDVPQDGEREVIETPAGLRVHRRAALQSPAEAREVWAPQAGVPAPQESQQSRTLRDALLHHNQEVTVWELH